MLVPQHLVVSAQPQGRARVRWPSSRAVPAPDTGMEGKFTHVPCTMPLEPRLGRGILAREDVRGPGICRTPALVASTLVMPGSGMARIAINAQLLTFAHSYRNAGTSAYIYHLLRCLPEVPGEHQYIICTNAP